MANIKVSELNEASVSNNNDLLMIVQNNESKKITKLNFDESLKCKTVTFNNQWLVCQKLYGGGVLLLVPILNPTGSNPTLNITSAEIYTSNGWQTINLYGVGYQTVTTTHIYLRFDDTGLSLTAGNSYLIRLVGTIICN